MHTPDILEYKSIKNYFSDYYNYRCAQDGHFSYDIWSSELNYKSRSFLPMVMVGQRNISEDFIENFSKKMQFDERQTRHLSLLARLELQSPPVIKSVYEEGLIHTLKIDKKRSLFTDESFPSFILNPLVKILISFKDFKATFQNIKNLLKVKEDDLQKSLTILEQHKFIQKIADDHWTSNAEHFEVKNSAQGMRKFHHDTLQEAAEQIDANETNKFRSIYFSVNPEQIKDISTEVEDFLKKLRIKYSANQLDQRQIMKVNVQAYTLSEIFKK